jgi:hypothetical protein
MRPILLRCVQLTGSPMRLILLQADDHGLQWLRQLAGLAPWPTRSIRDRGDAFLLASAENFVAGFARDVGFAAEIAHALPFEEPGDETQTLVADHIVQVQARTVVLIALLALSRKLIILDASSTKEPRRT